MDIENILRKLNFSEYEIKIYLSLNKLEQATANEISGNSSVPKNKVYEIIEHMIKKGLIMELPTKPKKYKISSLDKLKEIINSKKENLVKLEKDTNKLVDKLKILNWGSKDKEPIWIIKSQKNIVDKIAFEMNQVEKYTLSVFRNNVSTGTNLRNTKEAIKRGVKICMIGAVTEKNFSEIKRWVKLGVDFKVYDENILGNHGTRFTVFDDKKCRITIGKPEVKTSENYITIWSESESLTRLMKNLFYSMWDKCLSFDEYCKKNKL